MHQRHQKKFRPISGAHQSNQLRKLQLKRAIEKTTGIPMPMLEVIERGMDRRNNHPVLSQFLDNRKRLPSSEKIISRLLSAPMKQRTGYLAENLFTEYRVSLRSSLGTVEVIAVMRLFRKMKFLSNPKSHGIITVKYIITKDDNVHEYRQDFMISKRKCIKTKHSSIEYRSNVPSQWRTQLVPRLLAPPQTIYL